MNEIRDLYNQAYIYIHTNCNKNLAQNKKILDSKANKIFQDLKKVKGEANVTSRDLREIKSEIIHRYYDINLDNANVSLEQASLLAEQKLGLRLTIEELTRLEVMDNLPKFSTEPLQKNENPEIKELKEQFIKTLTEPADSKLLNLLRTKEFHDLAKEMDRDMESKLNVREFAELIGLHYPSRINEILDQLKTSDKKQILGADEMADVYTTLFLLQKNSVFGNALLSLDGECVGLNGQTGALNAALSGPYMAVQMVLNAVQK